jgi:hypothetical protein
MAGKKTPTKILEARNSFKNRPSRRRDAEPQVREPIGNPPSSFTDTEREAWVEIISRAPVGVLTGADWCATVLAARLFAEAMNDFQGMNAARLARLHSLLGDFGMSPTSRASLAIPQAKQDNPFADL